MICPVCESQVRDGAAFCPQCGTRLSAQPARTYAQQPAGTPASTGQAQPTQPAPYPVQPMQPAPYPAQPAQQVPQQPKKRNLMPFVVGVAAMLAVLAAAGIFFLLTRGKGIAINEKNFPDPALRAWVTENADEDGDGYITEVEAHKVIVIEAQKVTDAKGIEHFTNAQEIHLPDSDLITFDLGENEFPNLTVVDFTGSDQLTEVDLTKAPKLVEVDLTDTAVQLISLFDPDQAKLINPPDGIQIEDPNGSDGPSGTPSEPEKPTTTTWLVPTSYRSTMTFSDNSFVTTAQATYDDEGHLVHVENVNPDESGSGYYTETADYTYDDEGRLVHVDVTNGDTFWYKWDLSYSDNNCHASYTSSNGYNDLYIDYYYDSEGHVQSVDYNTLGVQSYLEGNVQVSYDSEGRIANIEGTEYNSPVRVAAYYHDNGRISRIVDSGDYTSVTYNFDEQGRLTSCDHDGYTPDSTSYTYGDGQLPTEMSRSNGGSISSTESSLQASVPSEYYTVDYEIEYTEIELLIGEMPMLGMEVIDFAYPIEYGNPWIRGMSRPFGAREILLQNEIWLAEQAAGTTETPAEQPSTEPQAPTQSNYQCGQMPDGSFVLVGNVHTHRETFGDEEFDVVSMTLDEPVDYMFEYKGNVSENTAREVELATSNSDDYAYWAGFDGQHIAVGANALMQAIHDASMHGVDTIIVGGPELLD